MYFDCDTDLAARAGGRLRHGENGGIAALAALDLERATAVCRSLVANRELQSLRALDEIGD